MYDTPTTHCLYHSVAQVVPHAHANASTAKVTQIPHNLTKLQHQVYISKQYSQYSKVRCIENMTVADDKSYQFLGNVMFSMHCTVPYTYLEDAQYAPICECVVAK